MVLVPGVIPLSLPPCLPWTTSCSHPLQEVCCRGQRIRRFPGSFRLTGRVIRRLWIMVSHCDTSQTSQHSLFFSFLFVFFFFFSFCPLHLRPVSNIQGIIWIRRLHRGSWGGVWFHYRQCHFCCPPVSVETDSFTKGTFSTWRLRFDVFPASGLGGANDRVLSLLVLPLKKLLILGCDRVTFPKI